MTVPVDEPVIGFAMTLPPVKSVCAATIVAQTVRSVEPVGFQGLLLPLQLLLVLSQLVTTTVAPVMTVAPIQLVGGVARLLFLP
jgi:hypothetical protein